MDLTELFTSTADAIRNKKETTEKIKASDFPNEILTIKTGIDTSDATATAEDIIMGKIAYANGEKVIGNINTILEISSMAEEFVEREDGTIHFYGDPNIINRISLDKGGTMTMFAEKTELANAIELTADKLKQGETVLGVEGTLENLDTSDATATSEDILEGKTAYVNNQLVEGTVPALQYASVGSADITDWYDMCLIKFSGKNTDGKGIVNEETEISATVTYEKLANTLGITPEKIAKDESILGVWGEYEGSGSSDLAITDARYLFYYGARLDILNELISTLKDITNTSFMFANCSNLTEVPFFDTSNVTTMKSTFYYAESIETIPELDASNVTTVQGIFLNTTNLKNFGGLKNLGKAFHITSTNYIYYKLDLSSCTLLTHDSLMNVINNLYDLNLTYNVANGGKLYTQSLVLSAESKALLSEEEIAIATNKGWTVS